jgi:hypothetical protein
MIAFDGGLYAVTGDANGRLHQFFTSGSLAGWDTLGGFPTGTGTKMTALTVFSGNLYLASYDSGTGNADIWTVNTATGTLTVKTTTEFNGMIINALYTDPITGLIYAGTSTGVVRNSSDGSTWTERNAAGVHVDSITGFTSANSKVFACGQDTTVATTGKIIQSSDGTTWTSFATQSGSTDGFHAITNMNDYLYTIYFHTAQGVPAIARYNDQATVSISVFSGAATKASSIFVYNGWIYFGIEDDSNVAKLMRYDGDNVGSQVLVDTVTGETDIFSMTEFEGRLYYGTEGGAEVWLRRPIPSMSIEIQNANSTNPLT